MAYKLLSEGVKRLEDGAFIPPDPRNRDWREYQEWLKAGNTPTPADPEPPEIDRRQLKQDLIDNIKSASNLAQLRAIIISMVEKLL